MQTATLSPQSRLKKAWIPTYPESTQPSTGRPGWFAVEELHLDFDIEEYNVIDVEQTQFYCLQWSIVNALPQILNLILPRLVDGQLGRFRRIGAAQMYWKSQIDLLAGIHTSTLPCRSYDESGDLRALYII